MNSICLIHRNIRLYDNNVLIEASKKSDNVYLVFIIDPIQQKKENEYFSDPSFQFLHNSLKDLKKYLWVLVGEPKSELKKFIKQKDITDIFIMRDYTPFAQNRAIEIGKLNINLHRVDDTTLFSVGSVLTSTNEYYKIYSAFDRNVSKRKVDKPNMRSKIKKLIKPENDYKLDDKDFKYVKNKNIIVQGGRKEGLKLLEKAKTMTDY